MVRIMATKKELEKRIKELEKQNDARTMDINTFQRWAAQEFMSRLCEGTTPHDAMWVVVNQAAMNEVWGGKRNES